jgi:4-amino-4-deoxy-L-arabinose transferase-like glycosyltransferase
MVVALLLAVYAALAMAASRSRGLSFDEGMQLAVGYNLWRHSDYRIEGANGDLIKRWATLPYLVTQPALAGRDDAIWRQGDAYELGWRFFFELGNQPEALLRSARPMVTLLGVLTGLLVFTVSRRLFGVAGGLISLALFVFSPTMLAFGGIVSTDLSITLTLFAATWGCWLILHEVTPLRLLGSLLASGLAVLAKPTALVLLPISAVLVTVRLFQRRDLVWRWNQRRFVIAGRGRQLLVFVGLASLHLLAGWSALWAHYGFRYETEPGAGRPIAAFPSTSAPGALTDRVPPVLRVALAGLERHQLLPAAHLRGIHSLLTSDDRLGSFADGEWRLGGWIWFFPFAFWAKTHPALILALALAGCGWWLARRRRSGPGFAPSAYDLTPWITLTLVYLAVAMSEDINLGQRHLLPLYPALYVLAGGVALWPIRSRAWRWAGIGLLGGWPAFDAVAHYPSYLSYFSPHSGGPAQGYQRLVDSSLDWGMNLPALARWQQQHNPDGRVPTFLAYFGTDNPEHYRIQATRLPGFFDRRPLAPYVLTPGWYAISASLLQGVYTAAFGPWSPQYEKLYQHTFRTVVNFQRAVPDPQARLRRLRRPENRALAEQVDLFDHLRFARLCAWLRHRGPPHHHVEHAILIWRLDYEDLKAALLEAPVELVDRPAVVRDFRPHAAGLKVR